MMRKCDGTDEYLVTQDGKPCSCGLTFDDVYRTTVYPHTDVTPPSEFNRMIDTYMQGSWHGRSL